MAAAHHAPAAKDTSRPFGPLAAEVRIGDRPSRLAEEDRHLSRVKGRAFANVVGAFLQDFVGPREPRVGRRAQHAAGGRVVRSKFALPVHARGPVGPPEHLATRHRQGVGVDEAPTSDARARADEHIAQERQAKDAVAEQLRDP